MLKKFVALAKFLALVGLLATVAHISNRINAMDGAGSSDAVNHPKQRDVPDAKAQP